MLFRDGTWVIVRLDKGNRNRVSQGQRPLGEGRQSHLAFHYILWEAVFRLEILL